jgi:hypothetical protein
VPLDDAKALDASAPIVVGPGNVRFDADKVAERHRAMVARLPKDGVALLVLGGSHDFGTHLPDGTAYMRVAARAYRGK